MGGENLGKGDETGPFTPTDEQRAKSVENSAGKGQKGTDE